MTNTASAEHATQTGRGTPMGALASPPVGEVARHHRTNPPPYGPPYGGGLGWEATTERAALTRLQAAITTQAGHTPIPMIIRDGLVGQWPWLHIARPDDHHVSAGILRMTGTAWVLPGPHAPSIGTPAIMLGDFPLGEHADHTELARAILQGLARGIWPVPAAS